MYCKCTEEEIKIRRILFKQICTNSPLKFLPLGDKRCLEAWPERQYLILHSYAPLLLLCLNLCTVFPFTGYKSQCTFNRSNTDCQTKQPWSTSRLRFVLLLGSNCTSTFPSINEELISHPGCSCIVKLCAWELPAWYQWNYYPARNTLQPLDSNEQMLKGIKVYQVNGSLFASFTELWIALWAYQQTLQRIPLRGFSCLWSRSVLTRPICFTSNHKCCEWAVWEKAVSNSSGPSSLSSGAVFQFQPLLSVLAWTML